MPRFYFHIHDGKSVLDRRGTQYRDLSEAREAAAMLARDMARLSLGLTGRVPSGRVVVADESGNEVAAVPIPKRA